MSRIWDVVVDGVEHKVSHEEKFWSGKLFVIIDGEKTEIKRTKFSESIIGLDKPFYIGEKECRFVVIGNKVDIAVDGVYLGSKKPYVPLEKMPSWVWVFIALFIALPIMTLGGALPVALAILGVLWCIRISIAPYMKTAAKVFSCIGITVGCWFVTFLFVILINLIKYL